MGFARARRGLAILCALAALQLLPSDVRAQSSDDEIVYIDPGGIVRVLDPTVADDGFEIQWFSPRGGYTLFALIDVNLDGDLEIAAARPDDGTTVIDLYDPVISGSDIEPGQAIGGVPWRQITSLVYEGEPALLAAGNLDATTSGAELLLATANAESPGSQHFTVLRNSFSDGTFWDATSLNITSRNWNAMALGDMDADGIAEIGLVSQDDATVEIWRVGTAALSAQRIYENPNEQRPWHNVAMGNWLGDGRVMLGAVRTAPPPFPSFVLFRLLPDSTIEDYHSEIFSPAPQMLFFGDINGSGDDEVFFLRSVPSSDTVRSRLFARNRGTDSTYLIEDRLDTDNGYTIGVAGDFDADGNDEIAVLRSGNLRLFVNPETNATHENHIIVSDTRNVAAGNLDRNGHMQIVEMVASPTSVSGSVRSGETGETVEIAVTNATNDAALPVSYALEDEVAWVSIASNSSSTPVTLTLRFDGSRLLPGTYRTTLTLSSASAVVLEESLEIPITLIVRNGLLASPAGVLFASDSCATEGEQIQTIDLKAPANTSYSVALVAAEGVSASNVFSPDLVTWPSSATWLTATSPSGLAPESITLHATFTDGDEVSAAQASVIVVASVDGTQIVRTVPVFRLCVASEIYAPLVFR